MAGNGDGPQETSRCTMGRLAPSTGDARCRELSDVCLYSRPPDAPTEEGQSPEIAGVTGDMAGVAPLENSEMHRSRHKQTVTVGGTLPRLGWFS